MQGWPSNSGYLSSYFTSYQNQVFFPVWGITIPVYLPPLLTASYFLDDSEVRAAAGDQYSLFLNRIAGVLPFHIYLSPPPITPWDCFMQTPSDWGMFKTPPFLQGLEWEVEPGRWPDTWAERKYSICFCGWQRTHRNVSSRRNICD